MQYQLITDNQQLKEVCENALTKPVVALDSEFIRTRTLYPQIGLVQLYDGELLSLIDPLACSEFEPLVELLTHPNIIKVLHSCSEDLETFKHAFGCYPTNVFDTQVAAGFLGLGESLGYGALVQEVLDIELDKSESRTDWLQRPLTKQQLSYAAADAYYLLSVYHQLAERLKAVERFDWVLAEGELAVSKKAHRIPAEKAYLTIKNAWQMNPRELAILKELARWRQTEAEQYDIALNFVVKEINLYSLAKRRPGSVKSMFNIPGMMPKEVRKYGEKLIDCIEVGKQIPDEDCPEAVMVLARRPAFKKAMAILKPLVQEIADEHQLSPQMLASKKQLSDYLKWTWQYYHSDDVKKTPDVLQGWRQPLLESAFAQAGLPKL